MKILLTLGGAALLATSALAQSSHNPAVKNGAPAPTTRSAHGANSFTQAQAKGRLAKAGYTGIGTLAKDDNGVWRGTASKGSRQVKVGLDYKGNITAN